MTRSVVRTLIFSDWYRHRALIMMSILGGAIALTLVQIRGEIPTVLGCIWFFVSMILLGSMLPTSNVINERKKQTMPFLMSLPISVGQYTAAKLVSTVGMFLIPWSALVVAGTYVILSRRDIPDGLIPLMLILATVTFVGFCLLAGVALVTESEGWSIAANIVTNSSYGFVWYLLIRNPMIQAGAKNPTFVWNGTELTVLGGEIAAIVLILGLTFYLQSRKRDFV
jgi:ABC-type Na+ efflux pump permease subunit